MLDSLPLQCEADLRACTDRSPGLITAMRGRERVKGNLEDSPHFMGPLPFERFTVMFGQGAKQRKVRARKVVGIGRWGAHGRGALAVSAEEAAATNAGEMGMPGRVWPTVRRRDDRERPCAKMRASARRGRCAP